MTAGFYSKDAILAGAWASDAGGRWLWAAGVVGALLTALYTFRMVFLTFFGEVRTPFHLKPGPRLMAPLVILAFLSIVGGFLDLPRTLGDQPWFSDFMHTSLPETKALATRHRAEPADRGVAGVAWGSCSPTTSSCASRGSCVDW